MQWNTNSPSYARANVANYKFTYHFIAFVASRPQAGPRLLKGSVKAALTSVSHGGRMNTGTAGSDRIDRLQDWHCWVIIGDNAPLSLKRKPLVGPKNTASKAGRIHMGDRKRIFFSSPRVSSSNHCSIKPIQWDKPFCLTARRNSEKSVMVKKHKRMLRRVAAFVSAEDSV